MKLERYILIAFVGNFLIDNIATPLAAFLPQGDSNGFFTLPYIAFIVIAAAFVAGFTYWAFQGEQITLQKGIIFGIVGFLVAIVTAFITGVSGILLQTSSFGQVGQALPNFLPYVFSFQTLFLLGYWVIPAAAMGWYLSRPQLPRIA